MPFELEQTALDGVLLIKPKVFGDARGYFLELYKQPDWHALGLHVEFVQDNLSYSQHGALRGLHYQAPPQAQGKLVSVLQGKVLDVAVDVRVGSPTYGQHITLELSAENHHQLYIPAGFAHGFAVLSEDALFHYKCTAPYAPETEGGIRWNDPELGIAWGLEAPIVSEKDAELPYLKDLESPFSI